ncbi:uncharacterized protein [Haliotis asinina]|uniref:uncharacterized protein n=1 Tax=Haliotis asinina TaxID=109174 RepID=UPI00353245A4
MRQIIERSGDLDLTWLQRLVIMDTFRALLVYLVLPVATSYEGIKAIVDIVHPDTLDGHVTFCRLQDVIVVRVQTGSDHLTLNLQRNSAVKENTPVYVVRHVGNKTVIVRDTVLNTEGRQEYLDVANMASIEVSCRITSDGKPQYHLRGFLSLPGGNLYEMAPYNGAPEEARGPVDDVLYILKPVKPRIDKQIIDSVLPYDEGVSVARQQEVRWTHETRRKRSTDEIHVDVVAIVDYSVYRRYLVFCLGASVYNNVPVIWILFTSLSTRVSRVRQCLPLPDNCRDHVFQIYSSAMMFKRCR